LQKTGSYSIDRHKACENFDLEKAKNQRFNLISESFDQAAPKMSELTKYLGETYTLGILVNLISEANEALNNSKPMNEKQVLTAAKLVLSDYYKFSVSDFILCFKNGLRGKYGKIYGAFGIQVLFDWLQQFHEDWLIEYQKRRNNQVNPATFKQEKDVDIKPIKELTKKILESPKKEKFKYVNIEHYCTENKIDYSEFLNNLREQIQKEYEHNTLVSKTFKSKFTILQYEKRRLQFVLDSLNRRSTKTHQNEALKEYSKKVYESKTIDQ